MNIKEAIIKGETILENFDLHKLEAEVLLADTLHKNREFLFAHPKEQITKEKEQIFFKKCQRRKKGEPIAHITNIKEFYGIKLNSDNRALIPRPETEILVEETIKFCKKNKIKNIIEIGTGSGNIAIAIAKNTNNIHVTAGEISKEALSLAKINISNHNLENHITLISSDLLSNIQTSAEIIIANLPYIGKKQNNFVSKEAQTHEPNIALFGGNTGLELYEKLFQQILEKKTKPQFIIGEIGFSQRKELSELLKKKFANKKWEIKRDLAGLDRYFTIHL